jgi:hypothetical protein
MDILPVFKHSCSEMPLNTRDRRLRVLRTADGSQLAQHPPSLPPKRRKQEVSHNACENCRTSKVKVRTKGFVVLICCLITNVIGSVAEQRLVHAVRRTTPVAYLRVEPTNECRFRYFTHTKS